MSVARPPIDLILPAPSRQEGAHVDARSAVLSAAAATFAVVLLSLSPAVAVAQIGGPIGAPTGVPNGLPSGVAGYS
ncbi:MAG: hypothetical protein H0T52_05145, partial [Lautropia sp.]|nr:hypothetical protein [Lautropia sp.]